MRNRAKCRKCQDVIESTHVHHFIRCHCESIAVDGGNEYWKMVGNPEDFMRLDDDGNEWKKEQPENKGNEVEVKLEEQLVEIRKSIADLYEKIHSLHSLETLVNNEKDKAKKNAKAKK